MQEQIIYKNWLKFYSSMLKPSYKKMQNTGIKKDGKIDAQEQLRWNGSPCFGFSFTFR